MGFVLSFVSVLILISEPQHFLIHDPNQHLSELPIHAVIQDEVVKGEQQNLCPLPYWDFDE